ncbi:Rha family transcriptional regulator [Albimonas donghaensis]|uniref:Rha family transcriptional regulator n=1 Tax=Albimonas donghaensis TaxID=356660 RepID=UPI000B896CFA|nr:Rha family transcriptional regulator [Albimonas donghaensis]
MADANMGLPEVIEVDGVAVVSSLDAADRFEKRHADVLRAVKGLDCSPEFRERKFAPTKIRERGGATERDMPAVNMIRDGFPFLAMGFTGAESARWKERYIAAFSAMEARVWIGVEKGPLFGADRLPKGPPPRQWSTVLPGLIWEPRLGCWLWRRSPRSAGRISFRARASKRSAGSCGCLGRL